VLVEHEHNGLIDKGHGMWQLRFGCARMQSLKSKDDAR
jgi:hypothetical protein